MREMNLGSQSPAAWSTETQQCLAGINLWLSAQAESVASMDIVGCKGLAQVYQDLAEQVGEFSRRGPESLEAAQRKAAQACMRGAKSSSSALGSRFK